MYTLYLMAALMFIFGLPMVVFPRPLAVGFCRLGKTNFEADPIARFFVSKQTLERIYDEKRAPAIFRMLGWIFLLQGFFF
ncbi:MAG: hypothetical protein AAFY08_07385 [Planctomycetota bacterium]